MPMPPCTISMSVHQGHTKEKTWTTIIIRPTMCHERMWPYSTDAVSSVNLVLVKVEKMRTTRQVGWWSKI